MALQEKKVILALNIPEFATTRHFWFILGVHVDQSKFFHTHVRPSCQFSSVDHQRLKNAKSVNNLTVPE